MGGVTAKSATAKNYYIFTSSEGSIKQHSWKNHDMLHLYEEIHDKEIHSIAMMPPYCKEFFTCAKDNKIMQWNTNTGELIHDWGIIDDTDEVRSMVISPDGFFLFTSHRDHTIKQFSVEFQHCMHHFKDIHEGSVDKLVFTPCGSYLYSAGRDSRLNKISVKHQKILNSWDNLHPDYIMCMAVTPSGRF